MKRVQFDDSRVLILASLDDIECLPPPATPFALLLASGADSPTPPERRVIEALAQSSCREMCFAGVAAEPLHDVADDVVEERGLSHIVTSSLTDETPEEVAFYFVECAGSVPALLVSAVDHDRALSTALEMVVSRRDV
jgi:hypothetical protein